MSNVPPPPVPPAGDAPGDIPPLQPATPPPYGQATPPPYGQQATPPPYGQPSQSSGGKAPVLSIISLIAGIVGLLGFFVVFIPFVGGILQLFIPAAAVVLGFLGKVKEPQAAKGLWLTGIITGFVGIAIGLLSLVLWGVFFATIDGLDYTY